VFVDCGDNERSIGKHFVGDRDKWGRDCVVDPNGGVQPSHSGHVIDVGVSGVGQLVAKGVMKSMLLGILVVVVGGVGSTE